MIEIIGTSNPISIPAAANRGLPRIGYSPLTASFEAPGDRRRFVAYAQARNIPFEIADPKERYDVVVLTEGADISVWPDYQHGKIVYDLIDSYLSVPRTKPSQLLRGAAWYLLGKHRKLRFDYLNNVRAMCRHADAVICSTQEQQSVIRKMCDNVHVILDVHSMVVRNIKSTYVAGRPFRLVWEGLPSNLPQVAKIAPVLRALFKEIRLELHVVTDPTRDRLKGVLGQIDTEKFLARHFTNAVFHAWDEKTCSEIVTSCDLALIPIDVDDSFVAGKPENKLLLLWRMGMPAVVSATPAYLRAMTKAGTPELACANSREWISALGRMSRDEDARRDAAARGRAHAELVHGAEATLSRWDGLFSSLGYSFEPSTAAS
jgi:hypothetical protein